MFKLQPNPTFKARVPITVPGQAKPAEVEIEFRHMGREAVRAYFESLPGKTDLDAVELIVVGWSGVDSAFSREALGQLLDAYPAAAAAIFETFRRELFEARTKN